MPSRLWWGEMATLPPVILPVLVCVTGDDLRIVPVVASARRSFLGLFPRDAGFTQAHLDEIRHDMSGGADTRYWFGMYANQTASQRLPLRHLKAQRRTVT